MRLRTFIVGFACGCAAMGFAAMTLAPTQDPADMEKMWQEAMEKYGTPAQEHERLARLEGEWNVDLKMWSEPDTPYEVMSGKASYKMIMGGRYLQQKFTGEYNGEPFEGTGFVGFDRIKQKYVSIWFENMGTGISLSEGTEKDGLITYTGEMPDLMQGKYVSTRATEKMIDDNTLFAEMFMLTPDGKEFKTMEMRYTRAD